MIENPMWLTILGAIIGAVIAALVTITVEYLRKPSLDISLAEPETDKYINRPASFKKALRLKLENRPLPGWAKWMLRSPALQCSGYISFHHLDGQNVFGRSMLIRWPETPEPIPLLFKFDGKQALILDPSRIYLEQRKDVFPGGAEFIDVACRFDEDNDCYGWNNESYFSDPLWRNPDWRLPKNRYIINVTIVSSGERLSKIFRLINDVGLNDFRLENALQEDFNKLKSKR